MTSTTTTGPTALRRKVGQGGGGGDMLWCPIPVCWGGTRMLSWQRWMACGILGKVWPGEVKILLSPCSKEEEIG